MTDAEQVACDALRSAGLDELADNLAFAREAVRVRETVIKSLVSVADDDYCGDCATAWVHDRTCRIAGSLFALSPEWMELEVNRSHDEALRDDGRRRQRGPSLFNIDSSTAVWRGAILERAAPLTIERIIDALGPQRVEQLRRAIRGDRAVSVEAGNAVVKPSEHGYE